MIKLVVDPVSRRALHCVRVPSLAYTFIVAVVINSSVQESQGDARDGAVPMVVSHCFS